MSLQSGQVIRIQRALYRVDYVNECRARIVPLAKRHVTLEDGREFDAERVGVNISPNSEVEVVSDLERAKTEIELAEAEQDLAEARAELARAARAPEPASRPATLGVSGRSRGGWRVGPKPSPAFRPGSLAAVVMARIRTEPGLDTRTLTATIKAEGNVAACISRFHQAGLIEKS